MRMKIQLSPAFPKRSSNLTRSRSLETSVYNSTMLRRRLVCTSLNLKSSKSAFGPERRILICLWARPKKKLRISRRKRWLNWTNLMSASSWKSNKSKILGRMEWKLPTGLRSDKSSTKLSWRKYNRMRSSRKRIRTPLLSSYKLNWIKRTGADSSCPKTYQTLSCSHANN